MAARFLPAALAALCAALVAAAPARGRVDGADPFDVEAHVSSATLRSQPLSDVPASVTVISRDDLRTYGFQSLAEALASVPGFFVSSDRNYSYAGTRGFGPLGDWGSRVLVMVDGNPIVGSVYEDSPIERDFPVDVGAIERIEVVRGPGSALYGTNAVFAIVNVVTRRHADGGASASVTGSTTQRMGGTLEDGGATPTGWDWYVHGAGFGGRGPDLYFAGYDAPPVSDGWARGADDERGGNFTATLERPGWSLLVAAGRRTKEIPTGSYGTVFGDDRTLTQDNTALASVEHLQLLGSHAFQLRLSLLQVYYRGHYRYALDPPESGTYSLEDEADGRKAEIDVRALLQPRNSLRLTLGVEGQRHFRALQRSWIAGPGPDDVLPQFDLPYTRSAAYAQSEWQATESAAALAGVRVERDSHVGTVSNPRLGLVWHAAPRATVKLLAGRAFRAPNLYELFYADGTSMKANPDLMPERVWSYATSLELRAAGGVALDLTGFRNELSNWIGVVVDTTDGLSVYRNQGEFDVNGVEVAVSGARPRATSWRLAYTYSRPDGATSDPPNFARHVAQVSVEHPVPWHAGRLALLFHAIGARHNSGGRHVDGYGITDLTYSVDPWQRLDLTVAVRNLFDRAAADPGSTEHAVAEIPIDGRYLLVQLAVRL
ncbi:MAG: TonB-dependent receptor [bacterium]